MAAKKKKINSERGVYCITVLRGSLPRRFCPPHYGILGRRRLQDSKEGAIRKNLNAVHCFGDRISGDKNSSHISTIANRAKRLEAVERKLAYNIGYQPMLCNVHQLRVFLCNTFKEFDTSGYFASILASGNLTKQTKYQLNKQQEQVLKNNLHGKVDITAN